MDLRRVLDILRRRLVFLIQATVVVGILAGVLSSLQTPMYQAGAKVLLRPPDAADEALSPTQRRVYSTAADADRQVAGQLEIIRSPEVIRVAAESLRERPAQFVQGLSVHQLGASDIVVISARNPDPTVARDTANAVAQAYLDNRREHAVAQLRHASEELDTRLADLQEQIGTYDTQINNLAAQAATPNQGQASPKPAPTPAPGITTGEPAPGVAAPDPLLGLSGKPTTDEALKAARYASAVQYNTLFAKQQDLLVQTSLKEADAELVASARTPAAPYSPVPVRAGVTGAILGLLMAIGIAMLRDQFNDRIRDRDELERVTDLTSLAEMPVVDAADGKELFVVAHSLGRFAEAIRSLRTSIDFLGLERELRVVAVTSPSPGDGKSRVAANLAAVYAHAGFRTIVVSADLRRPSIEAIFGCTSHQSDGLTGVVAALARGRGPTSGDGHDVVKQALVPTALPNLHLLPSGILPPNPAELLASNWMNEVFDHLSSLAERIIVDTPPVIAVADPAILAAKVDGVIVVASVGQTHREAARRTAQILAKTPGRILGLVVNRSTGVGSGYGYGDYYGEARGQQRRGRRRQATKNGGAPPVARPASVGVTSES